ncbi:MAG: hypothetical protein BWY74_01040 [Firmicutes bacterium ADurb.Bin419]|nr:MAG: hypothetical protein BWY74_01040 [Firmicutes bacterium ADurb.Bin419]
MNIGDTIVIKLGNTESSGRITAISDDVIVVSFDAANRVMTISRTQIGNEPDKYVFTPKDSDGRHMLLD